MSWRCPGAATIAAGRGTSTKPKQAVLRPTRRVQEKAAPRRLRMEFL